MTKLNDAEHADLLKYALGELNVSERAAFETRMHARPEFTEELRDLQSFIASVDEALEAEPVPKLPPELLKRLEDEMQKSRGAPFFAWNRSGAFAAIAAACLVIVIGFLFRQSDTATTERADTVATNDAPVEAKEGAPGEPVGDIAAAPPADSAGALAPGNMPAPPAAAPSPEFFAVLGSLEDFEGIETVADHREMKKSAPMKDAGDKQDSFAPRAKMEAAPQELAESDEATEIGNALPETDALMIPGRPKRIAMMATSVAINQASLAALSRSESRILDCFRDGYDPASFLSLRVFVGEGEKVTRTETFSANKMPLADRTCVTEVIEKTMFLGSKPGGSFTLYIRPMGNNK